MARPRRRHSQPNHNTYPVYPPRTAVSWTPTSRIGFAEAELKVESGQLVRLFDLLDNIAGYELVPEKPVNEKDVVSSPSNPAITVAEVQANAGTAFKRGQSKTAWMHEDDPRRFLRYHPRGKRWKLPPEDFVERATAKVRDWNAVGDDQSTNAGRFHRQRQAEELSKLQAKASE